VDQRDRDHHEHECDPDERREVVGRGRLDLGIPEDLHDTDERDQDGVLLEADEVVEERWDHPTHCLRHDDEAKCLEAGEAEGGIIIPPDGYLKAAKDLCTENNVLLIWDEIQTGFARTGRDFAWQHEDAEPDMMCLGKALGGGVYPVSAVVGKREVLSVFNPGDHGSTFGGNPLAAVVGIASIAAMVEQDLSARSERLGKRLLNGLLPLLSPARGGGGGVESPVEDIRGRGLLVGLEVKEGVDTHALSQAFLGQRILTKETRSRTFRFAPPLTITESEVDEVVARVGKALRSVS